MTNFYGKLQVSFWKHVIDYAPNKINHVFPEIFGLYLRSATIIQSPHPQQHENLTTCTMSREQYQVPTGSPSYGMPDPDAGQDAQPTRIAPVVVSSSGPEVIYSCGECGNKVGLSRGDPVRCKDCGHRILYKVRTKR
jgi:DNA-directed RNA polymerase I, II, and III subunit RPABC4